MDTIKRLRLDRKLTEFLDNIPENGMGYHIVDLELKNGNKLHKRIILNSNFLLLNKDEIIESNKIKIIKLHVKNDIR